MNPSPRGCRRVIGFTLRRDTIHGFPSGVKKAGLLVVGTKAHHLTRSQAVSVGQEDHGCVPMVVPAGFAGMAISSSSSAGSRYSVSRSGGGLLGSLPSPSPFPPLLPSPPFAGPEPYRFGGKVESPLLFRIACHRVTQVVIVASSDPCPMNV
jgi:hypothetical protein